jgi:multidrug resistance protein MdtO
MLARVALEPSWQEGPHAPLTVRAQTILAQSREIMLAGNALHNALGVRDSRVRDDAYDAYDAYDAARSVQQQVAADLVRYADELASEPPVACAPGHAALDALEQYGALDGAAGATPEESPHAPLLARARDLVRQLSGLPDWHAAARPSAVLRESHENGDT